MELGCYVPGTDGGKGEFARTDEPVSYTHLDVYKRQPEESAFPSDMETCVREYVPVCPPGRSGPFCRKLCGYSPVSYTHLQTLTTSRDGPVIR